MFTTVAVLLAGAISLTAVSAQDGVFATGPMGPTNPPKPIMGTPINQSSDARLLSLNAIDDFCIFAPPSPELIGNSEAYEVAWCLKERNNARVIPDGTISGLSFLKTDFYVQIFGVGDFTKINLMPGDYGGELDPHGALGKGNPEGGNVTVNIGGEDKNIEEWMMYISDTTFCARACINSNATYSAAAMCEHKLDVMGCGFVMPGNYPTAGTFETCDADVAYPPGWYPTTGANGQTSYSQFQQYWTGVVGDATFTVGDTVTPSAPYFVPSSSNCKTTTTVGNGIPLSLLTAGATGPVATNAAATQAGATVTANVNNQNSASGSGSGAKSTGTSGSGSSSGSNGSSNSTSGNNGALAVQGLGMTLVTIVVAVAGIALIN